MGKIEFHPTVLVVEDEPLVRMLAVDYLERAGFTVLEADCGSDALRTLAGHHEVAVLFSDVNMPGMDGMELARRVHETSPQVRVILTSGRDAPSRSIPGDGAFLPKPYFESEVTQLVYAALAA
jgi:CheY-like chemotaxis protein